MSKDLFWNGWFRVFLLALIFVIGGLIEPCDGHSCAAEVIHD